MPLVGYKMLILINDKIITVQTTRFSKIRWYNVPDENQYYAVKILIFSPCVCRAMKNKCRISVFTGLDLQLVHQPNVAFGIEIKN